MTTRNVLALAVVVTAATVAPAAEQKPVALTVLSSMERIGQDDKPFGQPEARIEAARNEWESFQVLVAAPIESITVTAAGVSELAGPGGAKIRGDDVRLFREEYVRVRCSTRLAELPPGLYADPLVPFIDPTSGKPIQPLGHSQKRWGEPTVTEGHDMYALPFDVYKGQNQPLWIDVHVPKTAPAGEYRGTFHLRTRGGAKAELPVTLTVWDFTLPDAPTHRNHFGNFRGVARVFGVQPDSERFRQIEARYCRAMSEHRLCAPLPSHLLPIVNAKDGSLTIDPARHKQLAAFIRENHVADIEVPRCPFGRLPHSTLGPDYKTISPEGRAKALRYYADYYKYLEQNGWADRAYVYVLDEPNTRENYEQVLVLGALIKEAAPKLKRLVVEQTYPHAPEWPDIDPAVDIWCPLWGYIDRETVAQKIAEGDEVFSYTALVQLRPYHPHYKELKGLNPPYWHIDRPLTVYRVPTWINRQYGITGLLYWSTVTRVLDPWNNPAFAHPRHYNGGGYLFYPGVPCGIDGPVASIRLKNLRDGMEDYEYFAILEGLAGKAAVKRIVDQIAPDWWDFAKEPARFQAARNELAKAIREAKR